MWRLPEHAEKVFSGIVFDVWQWEQELFDGSTTTFEAIEREWTALILAVQNDTILVTHQRQPQKPDRYRDLLWWRVPRWVDHLTQAKKELREEAGMEAWVWEVLRTRNDKGYSFRDTQYFIARDLKIVGEQQLDPWGEEIEVKALTFDEFVEKFCTGEMGNEYEQAKILRMKMYGWLEDFRKQLFGK